VYLIFPLIYPLAFPPVSGAKNPNDIVAIGKPDRQDPAFDLAEAVEPIVTGTVRRILGNDADGIGEGQLRPGERHAVLCLVFLVLAGVPVEPGFRHEAKTSANLAGQPYVRMASLRGPLLAREGRFDYLLVEPTGISEPLPLAEPRLGRRTVLTLPLLPPPQKN
jgi:hypothetical protein